MAVFVHFVNQKNLPFALLDGTVEVDRCPVWKVQQNKVTDFIPAKPALRVVITIAVVFSVSETRMRKHMDENHQDKTDSKPTATEDVKWLVNRKSKLWVPKRKKQTGFKGKTLWDWLNLSGTLAIPIMVVLVTIGFGWWQVHLADTQHLNDINIAATRYANDQQLANDQQQETTLKAYLDDMTTLLLEKKLGSQDKADTVASAKAAVIARAKTLTTLHRLNALRKATVVQFLYEAHLIGYLSDTTPSIPVTYIIDLNGADLSNADLDGAIPIGADLSNANLSNATLISATLFHTDLHNADLSNADLSNADLSQADRGNATLIDADLSNADLRGAIGTTTGQLARAKSLKGATMPDGSKHP